MLWLLMAIVFASFFGNRLSTSTYHIISKTDYPGIPQETYLAMGLQEGDLGNGWFNAYNTDLFAKYNGDTELISKESFEFIKNTLADYQNNHVAMIHFFKDKWDSFMLVKDYQLHAYYSWAYADIPILNNDFANTTISYLNNLSFIMNMFGCCVALISFIKKPNLDNTSHIMIIAFIGACLYHLLFETKAIYIYPWINLMLPIMAYGLSQIINNRVAHPIHFLLHKSI